MRQRAIKFDNHDQRGRHSVGPSRVLCNCGRYIQLDNNVLVYFFAPIVSVVLHWCTPLQTIQSRVVRLNV